MSDSSSEALRLGDQQRRKVLGDEFVNRSNQNQEPLAKMWREFSTEVAWGHFWTRPGTTLREKSLYTIAALVALGDVREMRTHMRGALNLGVSPEELSDLFVQVACYAGMSKAGGALEVLQGILQERSEASADSGSVSK